MGTICIDFDGVLAQYDGWKGEDILGAPAPGAIEFVNRLVAEGYTVAIHTTRPQSHIWQWLERYGLLERPVQTPYKIYPTTMKVPALVYIDDRGFRFEGDWEAAYRATTQAAWWEQKQATRAERAKMIAKAIEKASLEDPTVFAALDLYLSGRANYGDALEIAVAALADEKTRFVQLVTSLSAHLPPGWHGGSTA